MARGIAFIVYPGFDLLDLSGPAAVFHDANVLAPGAYKISVLSESGGAVASSSGITVATLRTARNIDTLMVMGGPLHSVTAMPHATIGLIRRHGVKVRRLASVCTGAFLLAEAGFLDGRRATTHWNYAGELKARYPKVRLDADRIFICEDRIWTSAGATAGIDLALALVEEDVGLEISRRVARGLVVYQRRAGGQSQYSALLEMEPPSDRIKTTLHYAREHLQEELSVPRLAEVARLSERQFSRLFTAQTGVSPARAVERLRAEAAKPLVEDESLALDIVARAVGFADTERLRQAFVRAFGHPPQSVRRAARQAQL